jgi:hypothetical protein
MSKQLLGHLLADRIVCVPLTNGNGINDPLRRQVRPKGLFSEFANDGATDNGSIRIAGNRTKLQPFL